MAWRRQGDKPLSESMKLSLVTHICVIQHQSVNTWWWNRNISGCMQANIMDA